MDPTTVGTTAPGLLGPVLAHVRAGATVDATARDLRVDRGAVAAAARQLARLGLVRDGRSCTTCPATSPSDAPPPAACRGCVLVERITRR